MDKIRFIKEDLYSYIKEFGVCFSSLYFFYVLKKDYSARQRLIAKYVSDSYADTMKLDKVKMQRIPSTQFPIWVLWWQGEDCMPSVVRKCYERLIQMSEGCDLRLITKDNFEKYVEIPEYITDKFYDNKFSITHFSDILRFALLEKYGGMWIDATVFVTEPIMNRLEIIDTELFTVKQGNYIESYNIAHGRWTGFLMSTSYKKHPFFQVGLKCFYKYWKEHDMLVDYFLIDYIIDYLTRINRMLSDLIANIPMNNQYIFFLKKDTLNTFNDNRLMYLKSTMFYKLSWKKDCNRELNALYDAVKMKNR
ncbi:MAG: capsular polysaccharide synthesis protein [Selenomonas sp.]|jgi:mannosyltransferase OCH1-like enzyme|nr:capsular polysaccharide synthesis protein [Selenomonas sp.]